ncbi:MAG: putative peptidoglycan glycosyltransferase FtsW [Candidatus Omnitrophota bacterium]
MEKIYFRKERRTIFLIVLGLTLLGSLMIYEASGIHAFNAFSDSAYFFKRQIISFSLALVFFFLALFTNLETLRQHSAKILTFTIFLLFLVLVVGKRTGGAKRWFYFYSFGFQPSELLKISFLFYCSSYLKNKGAAIRNIKGLVPLGIVLGLICLLLVLQPDLGTIIFWILFVFLFLFLHNARKRHLGYFIALATFLCLILIVIYPYRIRRMAAYLDPFSDPKGSGFQSIQSQIAYGEGGLWGTGFGEGKQKLFFLPAAHTDFIFSIIAEEFGITGSFFMLFIFALLFYKMFYVATNYYIMLIRKNSASSDHFSYENSILWGVILIFFLEITINIGVSCGLLPTKGLSLPFVSYGGSNLIVHYMLLGLFFNASRQKPEPRRQMSEVRSQK